MIAAGVPQVDVRRDVDRVVTRMLLIELVDQFLLLGGEFLVLPQSLLRKTPHR